MDADTVEEPFSCRMAINLQGCGKMENSMVQSNTNLPKTVLGLILIYNVLIRRFAVSSADSLAWVTSSIFFLGNGIRLLQPCLQDVLPRQSLNDSSAGRQQTQY